MNLAVFEKTHSCGGLRVAWHHQNQFFLNYYLIHFLQKGIYRKVFFLAFFLSLTVSLSLTLNINLCEAKNPFDFSGSCIGPKDDKINCWSCFLECMCLLTTCLQKLTLFCLNSQIENTTGNISRINFIHVEYPK